LNCREAWNFGTLGTCGSLKRFERREAIETDWNDWNGLIPVMNGAKRLNGWNDWNWLSVFVRATFSPRKNSL
jgi:hypothetical protein